MRRFRPVSVDYPCRNQGDQKLKFSYRPGGNALDGNPQAFRTRRRLDDARLTRPASRCPWNDRARSDGPTIDTTAGQLTGLECTLHTRDEITHNMTGEHYRDMAEHFR